MLSHHRHSDAFLPEDPDNQSSMNPSSEHCRKPVSYVHFSLSETTTCDIDGPICFLCAEILSDHLRPMSSDGDMDALRRKPHYFHHSSREALFTSATRCGLCRLMTQELFRPFTNYGIMVDNGKLPVFIVAPDDDHEWAVPRARITIHQKFPGDCPGYGAGRFLVSKEEMEASEYSMVPVPDEYPATQANVDRTRAWMDSCNSHPLCSGMRMKTPSFLPKRVLDISLPETHVLLYESRGEACPYATLSYCWGGGVPLKTTKANLAQHAKGIPLGSFPETLSDAIRFARKLGFRYLWIDALCIIQDDPLDWAQQATAMTTIYQGCALNIAVSDSPGCDDGMVRKVCSSAVRIGTASGGEKPDIRTELYAICTREFRQTRRPQFRRLETRGWTFQETLVSVATVYITHEGLLWECCEDSGDGAKRSWAMLGPELSGVANRADREWPGDNAGGVSSTTHQRGILYMWVEEFSGRHLSLAKDKLPAMAGIVAQLATATSNRYVAGLWKEDLVKGLMWSSSVGTTRLIRHNDRAPSWSWASVDGHVSYPGEIQPRFKKASSVTISAEPGLDLEILHASVDEVYPGTFGEVRGGRIEALESLWLWNSADDEPPEGMIFTLDEGRDSRTRAKLAPFWLLRLAVTQISDEDIAFHMGADSIIQFLLVKEVAGREDEYRRIGRASLHPNYCKWGLRIDPKPVLDRWLSDPGETRKKVTLV